MPFGVARAKKSGDYVYLSLPGNTFDAFWR